MTNTVHAVDDAGIFSVLRFESYCVSVCGIVAGHFYQMRHFLAVIYSFLGLYSEVFSDDWLTLETSTIFINVKQHPLIRPKCTD